ncbi:MAG: porin, partial [Gammaproteobacteria bacterium]|nr:porin [Gammaproteobacteria bacterium]
NKKLLTVAVTAGLAATSMSAIAADATIYGRITAEWVSVENSASVDDTEVNEPGNSYWGISVKEKLSGGLTALAKIEYSVGAADASNAHGDRQQWVGMSGNFGTIALGQFNGVYKSTNPDPLNASFLEARGNGGVSGGALGHQSYIGDAVMWTSPTVSGITASVLVADEQSSGKGNDWQASVKYENGPMQFWLAHSEDIQGGAGTADASLTKIGGSMSMAGFKFYLQYEDDDGGLNAPGATGSVQTGSTIATNPGTNDGDVLFVGATYKMGNTTLVGQYGNSDYDGANNETDYFALAAIHNFSKTTKIYGGWRQTENEGAGVGEADLFGAGIQVNF